MTRADVTILLDYLFRTYPTYKAEKEDLIESFYRAYARFDRNGVKYVVDMYLQQKKPFFPKISELEEIRLLEINRAENIINDPRNPFYLGDAYARRLIKINNAKRALRWLRPIETKELLNE